jgi:hypothetical protein
VLPRFAPADFRLLAMVEYADGHPLGGHDDMVLGVHEHVPDGGLEKLGLVEIELASCPVPDCIAAIVANV